MGFNTRRFKRFDNCVLIGDKIETGIEGWIKIGKRIKSIFTKSDKVYVDKDAATFLALLYLSDKHQIKSIKKVIESTIVLKDLSIIFRYRKKDDFIAQPFSVYLMTFEINDHILVALGVRSDGKISEHYNFDKDGFLPF